MPHPETVKRVNILKVYHRKIETNYGKLVPISVNLLFDSTKFDKLEAIVGKPKNEYYLYCDKFGVFDLTKHTEFLCQDGHPIKIVANELSAYDYEGRYIVHIVLIPEVVEFKSNYNDVDFIIQNPPIYAAHKELNIFDNEEESTYKVMIEFIGNFHKIYDHNNINFSHRKSLSNMIILNKPCINQLVKKICLSEIFDSSSMTIPIDDINIAYPKINILTTNNYPIIVNIDKQSRNIIHDVSKNPVVIHVDKTAPVLSYIETEFTISAEVNSAKSVIMVPIGNGGNVSIIQTI